MKAVYHYKIKFLVLLVLFVSLAIIGLALTTPPDVQAHPPYGFTPPAPPPPPGGGGGGGSGGGGGGGGSDGDQPAQPPPDYVIVQIERCDLSCSAGYAFNDTGPQYQLLAAAANSDLFMPLLVPVNEAVPRVEMIAHVQLVHQGSGWITEATISDAQSTRLAVPYAGHWQVFLVSAPELVTPDTLDTTRLNLAQLQTQLTNGPVLLGEVEANATETQWVKCPLVCVIEPPPAAMPVTGGETTNYPLFSLIGGSLFVLLGLFIFYRGYRFMRPTH